VLCQSAPARQQLPTSLMILDAASFLLLALSVSLGTFYNLTRTLRESTPPREAREVGLPYYAEVAEVLDRSLWPGPGAFADVADSRYPKAFSGQGAPGWHLARDLPVGKLHELLQELYSPSEHQVVARSDSLPLAREELRPGSACGAAAATPQHARTLTLEQLLEESTARRFVQIQAALDLPVYADARGQVLGVVPAQSLGVFARSSRTELGGPASLNAQSFALLVQLPNTARSALHATDHRYVVQVSGVLRVLLFYPETARELHLYPQFSCRRGQAMLDFRYVGESLPRRIPAAMVDLFPGDSLYIPPFYSVRSVVLVPNVTRWVCCGRPARGKRANAKSASARGRHQLQPRAPLVRVAVVHHCQLGERGQGAGARKDICLAGRRDANKYQQPQPPPGRGGEAAARGVQGGGVFARRWV
jgi:hypothetical protein